jgi:hypothetical protein
MRKAINENPVVQISVVGVLLVAVGFMFVTRVMGGGSEGGEAVGPNEPIVSDSSAAPADSATAAPASAPAASPASGATAAPTAAPVTTPAAAPTAGAAPTGSVSPEALVPGRGLPAPVVAAWKRGDAIVLLIVKNGAADDRLVRGSVEALANPGVAVFVATASKIARYSRITQGVGVNRVPALVVVRPKGVSDSAPEATVSYGFRTTQSVVQAVKDALYRGPDDLPYSPG